MIHIKLLPAALLISFVSYGQQEMHYFTRYFHSKVTEKTPYQRKYSIRSKQITTLDYDNDRLELRATVTGTADLDEIDEFLQYIRTLGQESKYKEMFSKFNGQFTFYHKNGKPSYELLFLRNRILYSQTWTEEGKEQLVNGTGRSRSFGRDQNEDSYEEYIDSLLVSHYIFRQLKKDTIYGKVDKQAEPKEGIQAFYQNLVKVLKYPLVARFVGKEGKVFVEFVVDESGKLTDFNPKTNAGYGFETKVVRKLEAFPSWKPAVYKGRYVKTRFLLPISYQLTD